MSINDTDDTSSSLTVSSETGIFTTAGTTLTINPNSYITTLGGYSSTLSFGQKLYHSAGFVRDAFPKNWNIRSIQVNSNNGWTSVSAEIHGEVSHDDLHEFWRSTMQGGNSTWEPGATTKTILSFNLNDQQFKEELKTVHKEVFDNDFIKDFEET